MNEGESKKSGFIREIIGCLTSPRSSFRSILEKPSLMKATALILVIAIVAAWASFNYTGEFPLTYLVGVFGTWLISSALIHGFSTPLGGNGTFRSVLTLAGYASAPLLIQQVLRLADSFVVSQEEVLQFVTSLEISAYPLLNRIANAAVDTFTIFRIWSMALLIIAIRENYKISTARSTVAAALSFILMVFISALLPLM